MTRKEYLSLAMTMVVLLISMLTGYVLLALVFEGNPLLVALVGFGVLLVSCFLVLYLYKMRKLIDIDEKNKDKDDENNVTR